jgi:RNA-directed DNA polymerase
MGYDTPEARWKWWQEGLSLTGYKPNPVSRVELPPDNGQQRPLGRPTGKDRVMQASVTAALAPEWEARFAAHSSGFRPGRGTMDAMEAMQTTTNRHDGSPWILDADISGCFDHRDHGPLLAKLPVFTTTLRQWLKAGGVEVGFFSPTDTGTPQGGVLSPAINALYTPGAIGNITKRTGDNGQGLEPDEGQLSRPVLRGLEGGNTFRLPGGRVKCHIFRLEGDKCYVVPLLAVLEEAIVEFAPLHVQ